MQRRTLTSTRFASVAGMLLVCAALLGSASSALAAWVVYSDSWTSPVQAQEQANRINRVLGIESALSERATVQGRLFWRVRVGVYPTREDAQRVRRTLSEIGVAETWMREVSDTELPVGRPAAGANVLPGTVVSGTIVTQRWVKASSPYRVTGAITIPSGNTLTIGPGVDVLFNADVQFIVQGRLQAVGTETDTIRFVRGTASEWGGIFYAGHVAEGRLEHVTVKNAEIGVQIWRGILDDQPTDTTSRFSEQMLKRATGPIAIRNCGIDSATFNGIVLAGVDSTVVVENNLIRNCSSGISCEDGANPVIRNNRMIDNTSTGIICTGRSNPLLSGNTIVGSMTAGIMCANGSSPLIDRCVVARCGIGISASKSDPQVSRCTIARNDFSGVIAYEGANLTIIGSNVHGNSLTGVDNRSSGTIRADRCWWGYVVTESRPAPVLDGAARRARGESVPADQTGRVQVTNSLTSPTREALGDDVTSNRDQGSAYLFGVSTGETGTAPPQVVARRAAGAAANRAPVIRTIPAARFPEDGSTTVDLSPYGSDADGDRIAWTATSPNGNLWASVSGSVLSLSAAPNWNGGPVNVSVVASDGRGGRPESSLSVTVSAVDDGPVLLALPSVRLEAGSSTTIALTNYVQDPDNWPGEMRWSFGGTGHVRASVSGAVATLRSPAGWSGTETLNVTVTDPGGLSASGAVLVAVSPPPVRVVRLALVEAGALEPGGTAMLPRESVMSDGTRAPLRTGLRWSSRSLGVATVDADGRVTAVSPGRSWIIASDEGGRSDSVEVVVRETREVVSTGSEIGAASTAGPAAPPLLAAGARTELDRRFAVVIGVSDYIDPTIPSLERPDADAELVREALVRHCNVKPEHVITLRSRPAPGESPSTRSAIETALTRTLRDSLTVARRTSGEDTLDVIVYVSGHGKAVGGEGGSATSRLAFLPQDAMLAASQNSVADTDLWAWLEALPERTRRYVLLDMCFGGLAEGTKDLAMPNYGALAARAEDAAEVVVAASGPTETARDGLFARYLAQGLGRGSQLQHDDGYLSVRELFGYVSQNVTHERPQQHPQILCGADEVFVDNTVGYVSLESTPSGAEIRLRVGGRELWEPPPKTPAHDLEVPVGTYVLTLSLGEDYKPRVDPNFAVAAGRAADVRRYELRPASGMIVGQVIDQDARPVGGARVGLRGRAGGAAPADTLTDERGFFTLRATTGDYSSLVVAAPGYRDYVWTPAGPIEIKRDATTEVEQITLRRP